MHERTTGKVLKTTGVQSSTRAAAHFLCLQDETFCLLCLTAWQLKTGKTIEIKITIIIIIPGIKLIYLLLYL